MRLTTFLATMLLIVGCNGLSSHPSAETAEVKILQMPVKPDGLPVITDPQPSGTLDHATTSFTQGLLFHEGKLYESTGQNGHSSVRRLDPQSGQVEVETRMEDQYFGEGLAFYQDKLYQLTWRAGACFIYDLALKPQGQLFYGTEGWGLTVDPDKNLFVLTDGSPQIRFMNPSNLITDHQLTAVDGNGEQIARLNESEWVNGELWVNVWTSDAICRLDPQTGKAKGWIKFPQLVKKHQIGYEETLNGIAYDPDTDTLWITGKYWPTIYRYDHARTTFFAT